MEDELRVMLAEWIHGAHREHIERFEARDFPEYENVFAALLELQKQGEQIDLINLAKKSGMQLGDLAKLTSYYLPASYLTACETVRAYHIKRKLRSIVEARNVKEELEALCLEMDAMTFEETVEPENWTLGLITELDRKEREKPISYGMPSLDYLMGGIWKKELTVIAARPSVGKTAFASQIAWNMADKGHKVIYLPLEMDSNQMAGRQVLHLTDQITPEAFRSGQLSKADWKHLSPIIDLLSKRKEHLLMFSNLRDLTNIEAVIRQYRPEVLFIDQLSQLRTREAFKTIRERFTFLTNHLKEIAMQTGVPIVLLCQVNRSADDAAPTLANLKESGSIEEDADNVLTLHRLTDEQASRIKEYENLAELKVRGLQPVLVQIQKQRNGRTQNIPMYYKGSKFKFYDGMTS